MKRKSIFKVEKDIILLEKKEKVSVIFPAYNEAGNIEILIKKTQKAFISLKIDGEAILVNDGSTDGTGEVASQCKKKYPFLKVYEHKKNMGLTKSLSDGFKQAKGEIIIFLCADLQSDPEEDIPKLLAAFQKDTDVVVGWRQGRKEFKRYGSKLYNYLSNLLFNSKIHDHNWIKAFKKDFVKNLHLRSDWHRFIVAIAVNKGCNVVEVPTKWYPRSSGKSKFGILRILIAILDMFTLKIQMLFIDSPIRFFGSTGLFICLSGICIILFFFFLKYGLGIILTEYTRIIYFLLSILMILSGIGLLFMGLLGEFILHYFEDANNLKKEELSKNCID